MEALLPPARLTQRLSGGCIAPSRSHLHHLRISVVRYLTLPSLSYSKPYYDLYSGNSLQNGSRNAYAHSFVTTDSRSSLPVHWHLQITFPMAHAVHNAAVAMADGVG
ncbi:unnamed protein product [Pleuronectes platessa]|uniref:Uncharacterized protein n=1 Tax=Pleuronectes platessa TaxID=8262 RepID=A0A9N7ZDM7_PLEPL|nr:unnamed protein product [Pleuronectes platessa]